MTSTFAKRCSRCGASIPPDAPEGCCLLCLVREGAALRQRRPANGPLLPNRFGDYEALAEIGRGGMGRVYRARQLSLDRIVALKVIAAGEMASPELVARFRIEAETAASLDHPNIVAIYEVGEQEGWNFFSMRFVEGQTLGQALASKPLPFERAARLLATAARAIQHAHERGVLHRDLKPGNILLDSAGEPHVTDFGLAKFTQRESDLTLTHTALGTPAYMSPEQAAGRIKEITTAADIYGLGAVLFEMLTGAPPFTGETPMAIARRVIEQEPPVPASINPAVPPDLAIICLKCLEKEPGRRYSSAGALADDLEHWLRHEPISAHAATPSERLGKWVRRKPVHAMLGATVVVAVISLTALTVVSVREAARANSARHEATLTLADMYTRSGLTAGRNDDPAQAALWFANAALVAGRDGPRQQANRRRTAAWRREIDRPVRALVLGFDYPDRLLWNPRYRAMIVWDARALAALVWDLDSDSVWKPNSGASLFRAVWDPLGDRMAAYDGTNVVVLAYPSGAEQARLPGLPSPPALAFSPDGRWLAISAPRAILWEWRTGNKRLLPEWKEQLERFCFSRDGQALLVQSGQSVGVCDTEHPGAFRHPPVANTYLVRAEFLPDAASYLTGDAAGNISVRDSLTGTVLESYAGNGGAVPIAVSTDGRFIARVNAPVIDRSTRVSTDFPVHKNVFQAGAFSPDGAWLASASTDSTVKLWALPRGEFIRQVGNHQHSVSQVAFSPDGTLLASSQFGLIRIWRLTRSAISRQIPTGAMTLATISQDGGLVAPCGFANRAGALTRTRVVAVATGKPVGPEIVPGGIILDAAFSPDRAWLALSVSTTVDRVNFPLASKPGSGNLQIWDYRTGQQIGEPMALPSEPRGLAVHPSGQWLAVTCQAGETVEIEVASRRPKVLFRHPFLDGAASTLANGQCAYSPEGRILVVYGFYQFLHLWDREHGRELIEPLQPDMNYFDITFNGSTLAGAVVTMSSFVGFLDIQSGKRAFPAIPYSNWPLHVQFSSDGRLLLTTGRDRVGRVWDWRTGQLICPALPHEDEVMAGTFIPGKPWVATGGHDGMIKFWDYRTGMPMGPPIHHDGWVLQLQATPDGRTLIASGLSAGGIELLDLENLFPEPDLAPEDARLLAEIEAAAQVHSGGELVPLTKEAWLERWRTFRQRYPKFSGHRLTLDAAGQVAWHEAQARKLESINPSAAAWHRRQLQ